ncbi:MAG: hypothetical protein JNK64_15515 [Myxococcales bacterium]|nr:hypothetical protein [Myxococcales bacterium]
MARRPAPAAPSPPPMATAPRPRLNSIPVERLETIERRDLADAAWLVGEGRLETAAEVWLAAAQVGHALGRPLADVRARLETAAHAFADAAAAGAIESVPYGFWRFHSLCTWAGCAAPLRRLPREAWSNEDGSAVPGLREVIDLLLAEDGGATITAELGALAARRWKEPFATRVAQPLAALHHALRVGDAAAFQAGLRGVVDGHLYMVRGELRHHTDGLMCLGLLGPLQVAVQRGLAFELDTPYLTLELLAPGPDAGATVTAPPRVTTTAPPVAVPAQRVDIAQLKMTRDDALVFEREELAAATWLTSPAAAQQAAASAKRKDRRARGAVAVPTGRHVEAATAWLNAAQVAFALGRPLAEVRTRLEAGARAFAEAATTGALAPGMLAPYEFWRFHSVCTWAGCAASLREVPRDRWADDTAAAPGLREVIDLLLAGDGGASITAELGALAARRWKEPFAKRVAQPLAALHHAVHIGDDAAVQAALDASMDGHRYLLSGPLRTSADGLMCLGLLAPLQAAVQRGLALQLDAPYLPIELVLAPAAA